MFSLTAACLEQLWIDVALRNPLNVPVTLTGLTLVVESSNAEGSSSDLEVEVIEEIYLNAKELRTVRVSIFSISIEFNNPLLGVDWHQVPNALHDDFHQLIIFIPGSSTCF